MWGWSDTARTTKTKIISSTDHQSQPSTDLHPRGQHDGPERPGSLDAEKDDAVGEGWAPPGPGFLEHPQTDQGGVGSRRAEGAQEDEDCSSVTVEIGMELLHMVGGLMGGTGELQQRDDQPVPSS